MTNPTGSETRANLDRLMEQARWAETLEALDSAAKGEVISGEAMYKWMRSWGTPGELPPPKVGM